MKSYNVLPLRGVLRSIMGRVACAILGLGIGLAASAAFAATVYDVENDFSPSNPSGPWTYGQYGVAGPVPDTTGFTPFNNYAPNFLGTPIDGWNFGPIDPNVSHNDSGAVYSNFGVTWGVNAVNVSPANTIYAGVRFTAPDTKVYNLTSDFTNVQSNVAKDVYVYKNHVQVDTFSLTGSAHSYNRPLLPLVAGDVVDFVVAGSTNVALDATFAQSKWSLADDFSITGGNPNGPWAYGTNSALPDTGTFTAFSTPSTQNGFGLTNTLDFWTGGNLDPNISHSPHDFQVTCCGTTVHWEPGYVNFGTSGAPFVDATWTAPYTGDFQINAQFFNAQSASSQTVYIYQNTTPLFTGVTGTSVYDTSQGAFYSSPLLALTAGDVIHFLTSGGSNISVTATIVPEPASIALLAFGMVAGTQLVRRRRQ